VNKEASLEAVNEEQGGRYLALPTHMRYVLSQLRLYEWLVNSDSRVA
jgi:hypothetical protein